jgi:hypothetical protein
VARALVIAIARPAPGPDTAVSRGIAPVVRVSALALASVSPRSLGLGIAIGWYADRDGEGSAAQLSHWHAAPTFLQTTPFLVAQQSCAAVHCVVQA